MNRRWKMFAGNPHTDSDFIIMNRREKFVGINRGNVNIDKERIITCGQESADQSGNT